MLNTAGGGVFLSLSGYIFKEPAAATTGPESSIAPFVPRDLTAGVSLGPSDSTGNRCGFEPHDSRRLPLSTRLLFHFVT